LSGAAVSVPLASEFWTCGSVTASAAAEATSSQAVNANAVLMRIAKPNFLDFMCAPFFVVLSLK
jgi:hypothetical protein